MEHDPSAPWLPILYALSFGFGMGITGPTIMAAIADLFQGKHFGSIFGSTVMGFAFLGSIGPWLGGYIHDITGEYHVQKCCGQCRHRLSRTG